MGGWIGAGSWSTAVEGPAAVSGGTGALSAELCSWLAGAVRAGDVDASPPVAATGPASLDNDTVSSTLADGVGAVVFSDCDVVIFDRLQPLTCERLRRTLAFGPGKRTRPG